MARVPGHVVALGLLIAAVAVVGWWGLTSLGPTAAPDAAEHVRYAEYYDRSGHLPPKSENYEYSSPPAYAVAAVYLQRAARRFAVPSPAVSFVPSPVRRAGWFGFLAVAGALLASTSASRRARQVAAGVVGVLVLAAVFAGLSHARDVPWSSGQLISLLSACGIAVVAWAFGRRVFPRRPYAPLLAAAATVAIPVVLRQGVVFHPELTFAFVVALTVLAFQRGAEAGWHVRYAPAVGALVGIAALTRQTAAVVAVSLGAAALLLGRRTAVPFVCVAAASLLLVAGPWWVYQASRFGNPIQSNLNRPGYMLPHGQPTSFYLALPVHDLVVHPIRNSFPDELLPKFHADLWSDWYGVDHGYWGSPTSADRVFASTQSVLGLAADAVALGGLALLGIPALLRAVRRRAPRDGDQLIVTLTVLTVLTWAAFVLTLVRFPQVDGDPIKASYMLYLAPVFAVFGVRFGDRLWRRGPIWRSVLLGWSLLYLVSYGGVLVTTY